MARIEITVPGERIVEEFTALVQQPTLPTGAPALKVGLVEISQTQPTELIPGPMGPQGPRGSRWTTGAGNPTVPGGVTGDMYLDDTSGAVWQWDGTAWVDTGTNIQGSPDTGTGILAKLAPVDGAGSGLDADFLDGQHGAYYLDWPNQTNKPATFPPTLPIPWSGISGQPATYPPTLPIPSSGVTGLDAKQASQDTAINAKVGPDAPSDGLTYGRKNAGWSTIVGGAVISDTPPPGPLTAGQLWWESDTGNTYIWVNDGDSSQWVQQNIQPGTPPMPSGATADSRNRLVNPAFQISQENGTATGTAHGYYFADQWAINMSALTGVVQARQDILPSALYTTRARINCTTAQASLTSGQFWTIRQVMEGTKFSNFHWNTATPLPAVLRLLVYATEGTYSVAIRNSTLSHSFIAPLTISAAEAGTIVEKIIPVPPPPVGSVWVTDSAYAGSVSVVLACNASLQGVPGWQAGNLIGVAGHSNFLSSTANYFYIFYTGLYLDPLATGVPPRWELPDEAEELRACQRYWQKLGGGFTQAALAAGTAASATVTSLFLPFITQTRVAPSIALSAPADFQMRVGTVITPVTGQSSANPGLSSASLGVDGTGMTVGQGAILRPAGTTGYIALNARM